MIHQSLMCYSQSETRGGGGGAAMMHLITECFHLTGRGAAGRRESIGMSPFLGVNYAYLFHTGERLV